MRYWGLSRAPISSKFTPLLRLLWALTALAVIAGELLPAYSFPIRLLERLDINDKFEHFVAYAMLALLPSLHERPATLRVLVAGLIVLGALLEFGQIFSAGRFPDSGDMAANLTGVCAGLALGLALRKAVS
jgi:VanZ family protein